VSNNGVLNKKTYDSVKLGEVLISAKGKKPKFVASEPSDGWLPYINIKAFEQHVFDEYTDGENCLPCEDGDLLMVWDGSRSGMVGKAYKGYVGSTLAKLSVPGVINKFLYYFLQGKYRILNSKVKGTGTPHVNPEILGNFDFPIIPMEEQLRIVAKIEELFSELDKGVEALQKMKMQLKLYRQAVLKDAFKGKLTNDTPVKKCLLKEYIENPRYGTSKKCTYEVSKNSVAVYRIPNIDYKQGVIDHNDIKYATFLDNELDSLRLNSNDILIIRSNGSISIVGRAALVKETDIKGIFAGYLMRLRIRDQRELQSKYLLYFLSSHEARTYIENVAKSTSGVNNINSQEIGKLPLPIFPYETQMEIISAIESRLSICDKIEQIIDESLLKAESMRQSILQMAFEGKLVTHEEEINV
jgi:type I restriction enzyme S subunit